MEWNHEIARAGEDAAVELLRAEGLHILERNYRFGQGEIDVIARDGEVTVFVEVKTRSNQSYGPPEYAVTRGKQRQIARIATGWLADRGFPDTPCRFDVIAVTFERGKPVCNHIENAFTVSP